MGEWGRIDNCLGGAGVTMHEVRIYIENHFKNEKNDTESGGCHLSTGGYIPP